MTQRIGIFTGNSRFSMYFFVLIPGILIATAFPACENSSDLDFAVKTEYSWRIDTLQWMNRSSDAKIICLWGADRSTLYAIVRFSARSASVLM